MIIVSFFRDILDGVWYWLYLIVCIIAFFYVLGIVADNKREKISKKLKEKKSYDIESGKEAAIAAMESKQVLDVAEEETANTNTQNNIATEADPVNDTKPEVMVINSSEQAVSTTPETTPVVTPVVEQIVPPAVTPVVTPAVTPVVEQIVPPTIAPVQQIPATQPKAEEPLVINSN